ncbi:MAG: FlgD immunoglobulin-like domain containing protein [bacterium]
MIFGFLTYGDTAAMWFDPLGPCTLKAIRIYSVDFEGNVHIDVCKARYDGHLITEDSVDAYGWIGMHEGGQWVPGPTLGHSPLGDHLWGMVPLTITEDMNNSWIEVPTHPLGEPGLGSDPFIVAMAVYWQGGLGFGAEWEGTVPYHFFKYYAECCGPDGIHGGWYLRSFSLWLEVVVSYYANTPPEISKMTLLPYTYAPGPFVVEAHVVDNDYEDPGRAGIASAYLHWTVKGVEDSTVMDGPQEGGTFTGLIPERAPGDTVWYYVSATDDPGLRSTNTPLSFVRLSPENPHSDILLVDQGFGDEAFYAELLDSLGFQYERWDVYERHGIDASVTEYGWSTVILFSGRETTVPTRGYSGHLWANFLDTGDNDRPVNLLYVDRNYFWRNDEPEEPIFGPGDFAYDHFGLLSGMDDPYDFDYVLYGVAGDPISDEFVHNPIEQSWFPDYLYDWVGYTRARDGAVDIFFTESDSGSGVRYDGDTFKTVFLPWLYHELLEDTGTDTVPKAEAYLLMGNILSWFGTKKETGVDTHPNELVPMGFALHQNYPNPFNPTTTIRYAIPSREQRGESGERRAGSGEIRAESGEIRGRNLGLGALRTTLKIYNILGQEVRTLVDEVKEPGYYAVTWDGRDDGGREVASGVYFYQLTVDGGQWSETKRMVLLR